MAFAVSDQHTQTKILFQSLTWRNYYNTICLFVIGYPFFKRIDESVSYIYLFVRTKLVVRVRFLSTISFDRNIPSVNTCDISFEDPRQTL